MIGRLGVAYLLSVDSSVGGFLEESPWSLISKVCWPEERRKQTERGQMDMILFPKAANNSARRNLHVAQLYWSFDILCHANVSPADVIDKSWCRLGMFLTHLRCFASRSNNLSQNMKEIGGVLLAVWWNGLFLKVAWSIYKVGLQRLQEQLLVESNSKQYLTVTSVIVASEVLIQ